MLTLKRGSNFNGVQLLNLIHGFQRLLLYSTSSSSATEASSSSSSSLANYLVDALGFSSQQSLSISIKLFKLRKSSTLMNVSDERKFIEDVSLVINFFKQNGFDEPQIRKIFTTVPPIALSNVDKTLKPKFELLQGIGFSGSDLSRTIILGPLLLGMRLNPVIQNLRRVLGSDENVRKALSSSCIYHRHGWLRSYYKNLIPNVELLEKYGIPIDIIRKHVMQDPESFVQRPPVFEDILIRAEHKFEISRDSTMFLYVFRILRRHSDKGIEAKFQVFESFGWTKSDFLKLIGSAPSCLGHSEATIKKKLEFFMKDLGYQPAELVSRNALMISSFEKRVLPRHQVLLVLKEKGYPRDFHGKYTTINFATLQLF